MDKAIVEKALSMRRDYTMAEIAKLLGVRQEELFEAVQKRIEGKDSLPEPIIPESGPPRPKPRGRKKKDTTSKV